MPIRTCLVAVAVLAWALVGPAQLAVSHASAGPAGRIEGRVFDAATLAPLDRANVVVLGTERGAATVEDGGYFIADLPPGTYRLEFSFLGYETAVATDVVVRSGAPTRVDQAMLAAPLLQETVVVRPRLFLEKLSRPVSTTELSREEIRRFPGGFEDVVRAVAALPGVALVNEGGRNDLLVRGGGPSENLYVVAGLEVPNINHFGSQGSASGALSFINLDFVNRAEFSTGGFGTRYGDRLSSVLDLDLRPGRGDRVGGKATISATQFGLALEGPVPVQGSFLFSARQSYLDLIFRAAGQPFIPVYTDFNLFGSFEPAPRDRITILGLAAFDRVERDRSTAENRVVNAGILDNTQDQWIGGIRYRRLLPRGFLETAVGHNRNGYDFSQADTSGTDWYASRATESETTLRLESFTRVSRGLGLRLGASYKALRNDNTTRFADVVYDRSGRAVPRDSLGLPRRLDVDEGAGKAALWVEVEHRLSRRLRTVLGGRLDHYDALETRLYPALRGALVYEASDRLELKVGGGSYIQSPSLVWTVNPQNRGLRALRNDMAVVGAEWLLRGDTNLSAEIYDKHYSELPAGATPETDYLVLTNAGVGYGGREDDFQSFGYLPLTSTGTGRAYGIDLLLQKRFSEIPCYGQAGLSLGRSRVRAPNGREYPSQFDQRAILTLSGGFVANARWELSGKLRIATGAPYTPIRDPGTNGGVIQNLPDEYLSARLNAFYALDLRADRRFNFRGWSMVTFLDVQNVTNRRSESRPRWDFWDQKIVRTSGIGILPSLGISAEF